MYKLQYLPIAKRDIQEIIGYIRDELCAPKAALTLLNLLECDILSLRQFPLAYNIYEVEKPLRYQYRRLFVKNYAVFYVVQEDVVEIHRVLYAKSNLIDFLEEL